MNGFALEKLLLAYLPAEKILPVYDEAETPDDASEASADEYAPLREAGLDPEIGLRYCEDDDTLFRSLLQDYGRSAAEKAPEIERVYAAKDWENYSILVHALKSTSRMIGAETLSAIAASSVRSCPAVRMVGVPPPI